LNDLQRRLLRHLDGQHDRGQLQESLAHLVTAGDLVIHEAGHPVKDRDRITRILSQSLDQHLPQLARHALLIA